MIDDSDHPATEPDSETERRLDEVVLRVARLLGRQMARDAFERLETANDNRARPRVSGTDHGVIAMTRVALYARYSSDNQRAASIDDQFRVCREYAKRQGWSASTCDHDATISGACMILRPDIQALLTDARCGKFDLVVAEALDRISRDQADVATLFKHLRFAGLAIVTLAEGEISELHVGLKGTMNALFLKDLAAKPHRGLRGRVETDKAGGGLCYGYDVVKRLDASGEPVRGERTINPAQAEVRRCAAPRNATRPPTPSAA